MAPVTQFPGITLCSQLRLNGVEVEALIDTGASVSCISENLYQRHRKAWGPLQGLTGQLKGADGQGLGTEGITNPLDMRWGGHVCRGEFVVLKGKGTPPLPRHIGHGPAGPFRYHH